MTKEEREDAIKFFEDASKEIDNAKYIKLAIEALKQTIWISVTSRLPKISGVYRVTRCFPDNSFDLYHLIDTCYFDGSNTWYEDNGTNHERAYVDNVIAWQENPEPYRVESEE